MKVETVRVRMSDHPDGSVLINKSEYDENPSRYEIAKEPRAKPDSDSEKSEKSAGKSSSKAK